MNLQKIPLITLNDIIEAGKQLSLTTDPKDLNPHILSSQRMDVAPLLGERLYNDIVRNRQNYTELLEGGDYEVEGETYYFDGLKTVIAIYAYATYTYLGNYRDTPIGLTEQIGDSRTNRAIEQSTRKSIWGENRKQAFNAWETVRDYLIRTDNPLYHENTCEPERNNNHYMSIKLIGR